MNFKIRLKNFRKMCLAYSKLEIDFIKIKCQTYFPLENVIASCDQYAMKYLSVDNMTYIQ